MTPQDTDGLPAYLVGCVNGMVVVRSVTSHFPKKE
jgi:hypothetical protein